MRRSIGYAAAALALAGCTQAGPAPTEDTLASAAAAVTTESSAPSISNEQAQTTSTGDPAAASFPAGVDPDRVEIAAIGVDAEVIDLELNTDSTLEVPEEPDETGWWTGGSRPGQVGPSVVVGHVDSKTGPAVFYRLQELEAGDEIDIASADGQEVTFEVATVEQHPKDDFPTDDVYGHTVEPTLRLVTCAGEWDTDVDSYRDNIIVYATVADG